MRVTNPLLACCTLYFTHHYVSLRALKLYAFTFIPYLYTRSAIIILLIYFLTDLQAVFFFCHLSIYTLHNSKLSFCKRSALSHFLIPFIFVVLLMYLFKLSYFLVLSLFLLLVYLRFPDLHVRVLIFFPTFYSPYLINGTFFNFFSRKLKLILHSLSRSIWTKWYNVL